MASQKSIKLFVYVDGVNDVPFCGATGDFHRDYILANGETYETSNGFVFNVKNSNEQIEVSSFRYDAKRMGGAPTLSFSLMYGECLDKFWHEHVYGVFNGERYFLQQTPTSSLSNDSGRYRHDVVMVAERSMLDNLYFYDVVVGQPLENDVPVSNSTKFHFYGHIETFVRRMNASLQYTGVQKVDNNGKVISGYHVVLDDDVVSRDQKQVSFDSAVFTQALQETYNTFGIPFYFDGQTIHVGFTNNIINDVLEYGVDGALISATKTNANFKVVNRATGNGSSDNIPYYYPNNSPKGEIGVEVNTKSSNFNVKIVDRETFSNAIDLDGVLEYIVETKDAKDTNEETWKETFNFTSNEQKYSYSTHYGIKDVDHNRDKYLHISPIVDLSFYEGQWLTDGDGNSYFDWISQELSKVNAIIRISVNDEEVYSEQYFPVKLPSIDLPLSKSYEKIIKVKMTIDVFHELKEGEGYFYYDYCLYKGNIGFKYKMSFESESDEMWFYNDQEVDLRDLGLSYTGTPFVGDTITQRLIKKVNTSSTLQPSIYRATDGKERFYNAINYPFAFVDGYELKYGEYVLEGEVHNDAYKKDDGTYYEFTNEYKEGRPREHVFSVDDIKPTIKEAVNSAGLRMDMFSEFAYNIGDSDETYIDPNGNTSFKHPYFFAKLRKLDFNLFDSASELGEMTFSMTSGNCGACNFKIGVDKEGQFNPVQVDENGDLIYDDNGYVRCGLEDWQTKEWPQDRQQDTVNYEVWIALKKEEDTYGILMPKAPVDGVGGHRPVACSSENANDGDTFVILNINLPDEYIYKAEKKLEKSIVKYIWENNVEKFNFSVNFSRIFLEENPSILNALNENARLTRVKYNGDEYILYVSSYSYSMNEGDVLPEIRVELDDTLTIAQNALQRAVDGVKSDIASAINAIDVAAIGSRYFLRKDTYDTAEAPIEFKKGIIFGDNGTVEVNEDGTSKLTIDYLDVTRKATFTSLEIQEQTHVGGQFLITPASMVCSKVEELDDAYRCYFESRGENGEEIFNQFIEGDQAISQTFNEWGGHYYWRLVTGIGGNYIDLSKTDCAPESDIPKAGNKIIQLGNRTNASRQAAQVLSSHGASAPSFIMYNGINSFTLNDKEVTGILWNPETQEPQMYSYGSFYFGDKELKDNFITFQTKKGETEKKLHINASVTFGHDSSGLSNLSEWNAMQQQVEGAKTLAETAIERIENIEFGDGVSPLELQALEIELARVVSEKVELQERCENYGLGPTYNQIFNEEVEAYIEALENVIAEQSSEKIQALNTALTAYKTARGEILKAITNAEYKAIEAAKKAAEEAKAEAEAATKAAEGAKAEAEDVKNQLESIGDEILESLQDDILTESEKAVLKQYLDTLSVEEEEMNAAYTSVYDNSLLPQANRNSLKSAYDNLSSTIASLKYIVQNIIDGVEGVDYDDYKGAFNSYKTAYEGYVEALEAARKAIEETIEQKADDANTNANAAKDAADAAKEVTDNLNNDNVLTELEKREIRRLISEITECKGASVKTYSATVTRTAKTGNPWYLVDKDSFAEYYNDEYEPDQEGYYNKVSQKDWQGYYSSNMHDNNESTTTRLNITVVAPFDLKLRFGSDAEGDYDYLIVGALDKGVVITDATNNLSDATKQANTKGKQGIYNVQTKTFAIDASKPHYIELAYKKDNSVFYNTDSGYYRLLNDSWVDGDSEYIMELRGSFHRYYLTLMRNGLKTEANELNRRLNAIMHYLNTYALWTSGDTTVPNDETEKFRDKLNSLLVDYFSYAAEIGFDISINRLNDMQYLSNAMKNGQTVVDGGLVLSSMVAVGDTENLNTTDVEAFLNGSDFAEDNSHGKLLLALGIPENVVIDEEVSTDLEDRAKEAKTRIYENGRLVSQDIHLQNGATIGNSIKIKEDGFELNGPDEGRISITEKFGVSVVNSRVLARMGGNCGKPAAIEIGNLNGNFLCDTDNVGMSIAMLGGEAAIRCRGGLFEGLRPKIRVVTSSSTNEERQLTELDHTIIVNDWTGYAVYLDLPSNPQEGQKFDIYTTNGGTNLDVYFNHNKTAYNFITGNDLSSPISFTDGKRKHIEFFFCGQWWLNYRFLN